MKQKQELIYGINTISVFLDLFPDRILTIFYQKTINSSDLSENKLQASLFKTSNNKIKQILEIARGLGIAVQAINTGVIERLFNDLNPNLDNGKYKLNHQGIAAYVVPTKYLTEQALVGLASTMQKNMDQARKAIFLVLDNIQDPGNLGACIRSAAVFGVTAVIISKNATCKITAAVKKAACGAVDLVPIAIVSNLNNCLIKLKQQGFWVVTLAANHAVNLSSLDLNMPLIVVLGSEAQGVRDIIKRNSDFLARIPMHSNINMIDSLNLSVATGICLYEINRQRMYG